MESLELTLQEDEHHIIVMAVFFKNDSVEFRPFYSDLHKYLGKYGDLLVATVGYEEEEVPRPHYHAHIILKTKKELPNQLVTCFRSQSDKKYENNTISLKKVKYNEIEKTLKDIVQYPLKEKVLSELCFGLNADTLTQLTIESRAEYDGKKKYLKKQREKQDKERKLWLKKTEYVKENYEGDKEWMQKISIMSRVATLLVMYYKEEEDGKLPYRNKLEQEMLRYCVQNLENSVSIETIIEKYYRM